MNKFEPLGWRGRGWRHDFLAEIDHPLGAFAPAALPVQADAVVAFLSRTLATSRLYVSQNAVGSLFLAGGGGGWRHNRQNVVVGVITCGKESWGSSQTEPPSGRERESADERETLL